VGILSALFDNKTYNFEQAFGVNDITSKRMKAAINDWYGLYYRQDADKEEDPCQRIPVAIVSKLTKTAFSEYSATTAKDSGNEYVEQILAALDSARKKAVQQALIGGLCFLKPIFSTPLHFTVISRNNMLILARDDTGVVTSVGTAERTVEGKDYYTLLERRTVDQYGRLTIQSKLYRSREAGILGVEVPLNTLNKYADLSPELLLPGVGSLGLIPVRTPLENCVDGSQDAVSVFAPAVGLIRNINRNEAQINQEFENGKSRIIASADMLAKNQATGRRELKDDLFVGVDDDPEAVGITIFSPAFREQSFLARKTEYLRNVESLIGLKRGILSEVEAAERTATEVTSSAGDYNLSIIEFQEMWETAVREAVRVCEALGRLYKVYSGPAIDPEKDVVIDWGNGILFDEDKTWADYMAMVAAGMIRPEIALAWKFNLPWETPKDLAKIREKYMPELQSMTDGEDGEE